MADKEEQSNPKVSKFWGYANFNPWGARTGDCAIRAVSAATGLDYREVCRRLHVSYKNGRGLLRDTGISLQSIKSAFSSYFDIVEDFNEDNDFIPPEMEGSPEAEEMAKIEMQDGIAALCPSGITLEDFMNMFSGKGVFLVSLVGNPNAEGQDMMDGGHIVCARCIARPGKRQVFIDIFDSHEMLVDAYMRLKRIEPKDSPFHWKFDSKTKKFIL